MEFEKRVVDLDVNDVLPNRFQPRIKFNEDSINELCESIKEHGVIQPIVVRAMGDKYEIIAGERRYKASLLAGKQTIPAVITELNDKDSAEVALIENVQRKDLTPIEEAISYKKILDMGYLTQEELAIKLGKTQSTVANKLRLLNLDEEVQEAVLEEKISERHARSLLKLVNMSNQRKMLENIIQNRLTVRKTDEEISIFLNSDKDINSLNIDLGNDVPMVYDEIEEEKQNPFKIAPISAGSIPTFDTSNVIDGKSLTDEPIVIIDDPEQLPVINEDQVIVDPMEEFNPFKLENNSINQVVDTNNNIPSNPIEDIKEEKIEGEEMNDLLNDKLPELNPGFMNIDKIESSAKDINIDSEKEPIDINSLLKPSIVGGDVVNVEPEKSEPVEEIKTGKFFDLPMGEDQPEEIKNESTEKNIATGITDAFNFDLGNQFQTSYPIENDNKSIETTNEPILPSLGNNELFNFNIDELNAPIINNNVQEGLNTNPSVTLPTFDQANFSSENVSVPETLTENIDTNVVTPVANNENIIESMTMPLFDENISTPANSTMSAEDNLVTDTGISVTTPVSESVILDTNVPTLADGDITSNLINPNFDFNISAPIEREQFVSIEPITSEEVSLPTVNANISANKSIANALEIVRNNTKELEKLGYIVDTEEFDFENVYQVIIKIEK